MEQEPKGKILSLKEYLELERQEMLSPENKWFAGEKLGHSPTDQEAEQYYVENGGPEGFAKRHILKARMEKEKEDRERESRNGNNKP